MTLIIVFDVIPFFFRSRNFVILVTHFINIDIYS